MRVLASGGQDVNHLDERYDGEVPDILDNAYVIVDFADGRRALLDLCMFAEGSRWEQELVATGDAGKVEVNLPNFMEMARGREPEMVVGSRGPDWPVTVGPVPDDDRINYHGGHHGASYLEHVGFCDAIRSGAPPAVTVDDGAAVRGHGRGRAPLHRRGPTRHPGRGGLPARPAGVTPGHRPPVRSPRCPGPTGPGSAR